MSAPVAITIDTVSALRDDTASIVGTPHWIGSSGDGAYFVVDNSDRNVKLYDGTGRRTATIGRSGEGPGEFVSLMSAEFLGDSLIGYDFARGLATVFTPEGEPSRTLRFPEPPWTLRVFDDSLLVAAFHPGQREELIRLLRHDGTVVRSFFDLPKDMSEYPEVAMNSTLWMDTFEGVIFAALFGDNRVFALSPDGSTIATLKLDLPSFAAVAAQHGGQLRSGTVWHQHGLRAIMQIVALRDSAVAIQTAPYDTRLGTDRVEGGELLIARVQDGALEIIARDTAAVGLFGRDLSGGALGLGYAAAVSGRYFLVRLSAARWQ